MEIWKDVVGYEGLYKVSNLGNIFSIKKNILLKQGFNRRGYKTVSFNKKGVKKSNIVHRLVAISFIQNINNKPCVNHINGIKDDNRVENLEWVTYSENMKHSYYILGNRNLDLYRGKIKTYKQVSQFSLSGEFIRKWESMTHIKLALGIPQSNISCCCKGKQKTAKGFIWRYA